MNSKTLLIGLFAAIALVGVCIALVVDEPAGEESADDAAQQPPVWTVAQQEPAAESEIAQAPPTEAATSEAASPEAAPPEGLDGLVAHITTLLEKSPEGNTREEMLASLAEFRDQVVTAADQVLDDTDATVEHVAAALKGKLQALADLKDLGKESAVEQFEATITQFADDAREEIRAEIAYFDLRSRIMSLAQGEPADAESLLNELETFLGGRPKDVPHFTLAVVMSRLLERNGEEQLAMRSYRTFGEMYADSENQLIDNTADQLIASAEKLEIIGSPLEISGTLVDGSTFDWEKYRGKVVLVDFWATWCGPCIQELPNVKANYEKYHDRGFEIVGISLDDAGDAEKLQTFLEKEQIPWETLFSTDPDATGWAHPMATEYGITGIPAMFLVDQEGNVVSVSARGPNLEKRLEEMLGTAGD